MSEQIEGIILEQSPLFLNRDEEMKGFLLKHFENLFEDYKLLNLDRFDMSERILKAGFHKELSGWLNIYKNIVISSHLIEAGKKKRYDYKFYFIEEKLDEETIELITDGLNEVESLKRKFKFEEAIAKVDEMLNLIKNKEDRVFNLKLYHARTDVIDAEIEYKRLMARLIELEKIIKVDIKIEDLENDDLNFFIENCEEIVQISKALKKGPLIRKYSSILEKSKNEIKLRRDLARLEQYILQNRERKNFIAAINDCENIIKLATDNAKTELAEKYTQILKEINEEIEKIKNNIEIAMDESAKLIEDSNFEDAFSKINFALELLDITQFKGYENYEKRLLEKRTEYINIQEDRLKLAKDITELDNKLKQKIENKKLFSAKNYCERLIELSKENNKDELVNNYMLLLEQINKEIDELKEKIEDEIKESEKLSENLYFEEAISNINSMLKIIGENLPAYRIKLENTKNIILKAENEYRQLEREIDELNEVLGDYLVRKNFTAAIEICEKIINIYKQHRAASKLIDNYTTILNQLTNKVEEIKKGIEILLEESYSLVVEYLFKEALSKIANGMDLIGEQDLPEYSRKLKIRKEQIFEAQEKYIKFTADVEDLEKQLEVNLENKNLVMALNKSDLLINIYESLNQPELIKKYTDIYNEINKEVGETRSKVDTVIITSHKLSANFEFEVAISNIDKMLKSMEEQNYPDLKRALENKRQEIISLEVKYKKYLTQIEELDKELEDNIKEENYVAALNICEEIIHISELNNNQEYIKKYKNKLKEIKSEFQKFSKLKSSLAKGAIKVKGSLAKGSTKAKSSLTKGAIKAKSSLAKGAIKVTKGVSKIKILKEKPLKKELLAEQARSEIRKSKTSCIRKGSSFYPYIRWTPIRRLMKDAGAHIVACKAVIELIEWMGTAAETITKTALTLTEHAKRKKISKYDILFAVKYLKS